MVFFILTSLFLKVSTSYFKYMFLIITHMMCYKIHSYLFISYWHGNMHIMWCKNVEHLSAFLILFISWLFFHCFVFLYCVQYLISRAWLSPLTAALVLSLINLLYTKNNMGSKPLLQAKLFSKRSCKLCIIHFVSTTIIIVKTEKSFVFFSFYRHLVVSWSNH